MVAVVSHAGAMHVLLQALDIPYRVTHGQWQVVQLSKNQLMSVGSTLPKNSGDPRPLLGSIFLSSLRRFDRLIVVSTVEPQAQCLTIV